MGIRYERAYVHATFLCYLSDTTMMQKCQHWRYTIWGYHAHSNTFFQAVLFAVNKQLNDKERVAAALENENLSDMVNKCLASSED